MLVLEQLNAYTKKSDCFRRAAGAVRVRCGDLEMDETERVGGEYGVRSPQVALCLLVLTLIGSGDIHDPLRTGHS